MTPEPLTVGDYLHAAELATGLSTARLLELVPRSRLLLALMAPFDRRDGRLVHRSLPAQAAALGAGLAGSSLLPDCDIDVAVMSMVAFLAVNGRDCRIAREHASAVALLERVVGSELSERDLAAWIEERIV